jgi:MYXO-CTERM domain-containing protein
MKSLCAAAVLGLAGIASAGIAQPNIIVTEVWAGGLPGAEATADWFEITNFGDAPFALTNVFFDDDSADPTTNNPIANIASVAPGESVIVLTSWLEDFGSAENAVSIFQSVWGESNLAGVQIGWIDGVTGGPGLGGGGDAVFLFDGNTEDANLITAQVYTTDTQPESFIYNPLTGEFGEYAQVGVFGAFESTVNASGGLDVPAVGSPGFVPTPGAAALLGLAGLAAGRRRRH